LSAPPPDLAGERPTIRLRPGAHRRTLAGHPWVYSNEIEMTPAAKALPPGTPARLLAADGRPLGVYGFNPQPLIAARLLSRDPEAAIDEDFVAARLGRALALRERLVGAPFYRLVHAEADGLPGLIVDRYGDCLVVQPNSAVADRLAPLVTAALRRLLAPAAIVLRGDSPARTLEGLAATESIEGAPALPLELIENGARFFADPVGGQKTGWFYDQRDNRAMVARLARGLSMLDAYCYSGGFAVQAALGGAAAVTGIDRSADALALAERAAAANGVAGRCAFRRGEVFAELAALAGERRRFDIVAADPPAFVKSRKDLPQGLRAYRKLARLAAALVAPGGFLFIASCSHNVAPDDLAGEVARALADAGRGGRILHRGGAAPDHPVHPALPETAYLKAELLQLD
jgi:23S rRNA (cytosine1962-C5)-methyltransferase